MSTSLTLPRPYPRLEVVVWCVPSLLGDAIAIAFIGVLLGPMYPIAANHAGRVLPQWLLTASMGWIVGGGQAGSALIPFITGVIAQRVGIQALQPVYVLFCMRAVEALIWVSFGPGSWPCLRS